MRSSRLVRSLRETVDVEGDSEWLSSVLEVIAPHTDDGLGVAAMMFDVGDVRRIRGGPTVGAGLPRGLSATRMVSATMQASPEYVQATYRVFDCATASEIGADCERFVLSRSYDHGLRDLFCLGSILPTGDVGCGVFSGLRARRAVGRRCREQWRVVTRELRKVLALRVARSAKTAVARVPRPRVHASVGELTSTPGWSQLAAEGWSPVRGYHAGDRPFVVVTRGERDPVSSLTPREREAASMAIRGIANKAIAYELGVTASTVGVLLWRAMGKLGVGTRDELAAVLGRLNP
ncbi:MAG: helix-turn-helix transcriptional regulator [Labilithrix sp.]|nr:helix-turn-helix transcriptional regulator [Labilithrix sp.]